MSVNHSVVGYNLSQALLLINCSQKLLLILGIELDLDDSSLVHVNKKKIKNALTGNRTRASRVAGENSTTEPSVLFDDVNFGKFTNQRSLFSFNFYFYFTGLIS